MNLLQLSRYENVSNRELHPKFTTRRKPARRFSPASMDSKAGNCSRPSAPLMGSESCTARSSA